MDDKLINLIVTVVVIGIWAAQFFLKPKQDQQDHRFDEDEEDESPTRPRNTYAEDPYIKVQEEIRRKIAERQAAQQAAQQDSARQNAPQHPVTQRGQTHSAPQRGQAHPATASKQTHPAVRPLSTQPEPRASVTKEMSPVARRQVQPAAQSPQSIDEIRRRRELAEQGQMRRGNVGIDRDLRPIPQAQLPERTFPTAQLPAQKTAFPSAARSGQAAYHGSTKLRRQANPRNAALKAALRTPSSTRQAILLREILDKPLGLR